jgi:hypothetical protein
VSIYECCILDLNIIEALKQSDYSKELQEEVCQYISDIKKELEVAKTNEETYRLEMLDITKRLGLDEETLFDDVKDKAERLNKQLQLISDEFLKYDWENSSKEQIINQLKSLYNSIFKGNDKDGRKSKNNLK